MNELQYQSAAAPSASREPVLAPNDDDPLRQVRHDLRHALYVSELALTLLADSRSDEGRFNEVLQMLRKEQANMQSLVDDLLTMASVHGPTAAYVQGPAG